MGHVESAACRLYGEHEAFNAPGAPPVTYETGFWSCTADTDCTVCNGLDTHPSGNRCDTANHQCR